MEVVQVHSRSLSLEGVQLQEVLVLEVVRVAVQELSSLSSGEEVVALEEFFECRLLATVEVAVGTEHQVEGEVGVGEVVLLTEWQHQL
jgi:hypothetical protein